MTASFSNPAGSCVVAFWSQSDDLERCPLPLAGWLMPGTAALTCLICLASTALAGQIEGRELGQSARSMGLRVWIWEMGRGRGRFNLSTGILRTFVVLKLAQILTWPSSYNFNPSSAVISACSNLLTKRICGSRKNLYRSRKPWGVVSWSFFFSCVGVGGQMSSLERSLTPCLHCLMLH